MGNNTKRSLYHICIMGDNLIAALMHRKLSVVVISYEDDFADNVGTYGLYHNEGFCE